MNISASIEIVMQLAGQEAVSGRFGEIEPEHVLAAMLKFSELPVEQVRNIAPGADVVRQLSDEVHTIRHELAQRGIDSKRTRRKLRAELGKGGGPPTSRRLHRSQACKAIFDTAAKLTEKARNDVMTAMHLLKALLASPTPMMLKVLGDAIGKKTVKAGETPLMDKYGRDLTQMAADGKLTAAGGREAECKALMLALGQENRRGVLLVADSDALVLDIVGTVAHSLAGSDVPAGMRGRQIIDVTALKPSQSDDEAGLDCLVRLLAEAAGSTETILLVPPIGTSGCEWAEMLKVTLSGKQVRCICRVPPAAYLGGIEKDSEWKRVAHVIWLHEGIDSQLPREL